MLELAAKVWRLGVTATVGKLRRQGVHQLPSEQKLIQRYVADRLVVRENTKKLWKAAASNTFATGGTILRLANKFRWKLLTENQWEELPGQIVGELPAKTANDLLRAGKMTGRRSVFRDTVKAKWDDVMVFPMQDLPGRICSFLFVGRTGRKEQDQLLIPAWRTGPKPETGLSFHPGIFASSLDWKRQILAINDPLLGVRIQSQQSETDYNPLPVVAWYNDTVCEDKQAWNMFHGQQLVFWAPQHSVDAITRAIRHDGLISTVGPTESGEAALEDYIGWQVSTPKAFVNHILKSARPWPVVVADYLSELQGHEIESFLLELELDGINLSEVASRTQGETRERLSEILSQDVLVRTCQIDEKTVVESGGQWTVQNPGKPPEIIMNATMRVEAVIHHEKSERTYCQGHVVFEGKTFKFCLPREQLKKAPFDALDNLVVRHGSLIYNSAWAKKILPIALHFQKPEAVRGADHIGWDREDSRFIFPQFAMHVGGKIETMRRHLFPEAAPGSKLRPPEILSGQDLDLLLDESSATTATTLATLVAVTANIVAPSHGEFPCGIGVTGRSAVDIAYEAAQAMGCHTLAFTTLEKTERDERAHNWPALLRREQSRAHLVSDWVDLSTVHAGYRNCLLELAWYRALVRQLYPGWHIIEDSNPANPVSDAAKTTLSRFLPAYIADLCDRQLRLEADDNDCWFDRIRSDILGFVKRHHGTTSRWSAIDTVVVPSDAGNPEALARILGQLVRENKLIVRPPGFSGTRVSVLTRCDEENSLVVAKEIVKKHLLKKYVHLTDLNWISSMLSREGVLLRDSEQEWELDLRWWVAAAKRSEPSASLRVV